MFSAFFCSVIRFCLGRKDILHFYPWTWLLSYKDRWREEVMQKKAQFTFLSILLPIISHKLSVGTEEDSKFILNVLITDEEMHISEEK